MLSYTKSADPEGRACEFERRLPEKRKERGAPEKRREKGKERGERRRSYRHAVFCRNGLSCLSCGTEVVREVIGGRRLDFCPSCQSMET